MFGFDGLGAIEMKKSGTQKIIMWLSLFCWKRNERQKLKNSVDPLLKKSFLICHEEEMICECGHLSPFIFLLIKSIYKSNLKK